MCLIPIYPMCGDTAGHCGVKKDHYALLILSLENTSAPYLCEVYILMLYQYMYSFLWLTTSYSCNGRFFFTPIWSRSFFTPLYDSIFGWKKFIVTSMATKNSPVMRKSFIVKWGKKDQDLLGVKNDHSFKPIRGVKLRNFIYVLIKHCYIYWLKVWSTSVS